MELTELIHKLEKARTKDDLEALGIEHLGIDVDKRKAKEVIRAELIGEAELRLGDDAPAAQTPEPQSTPDPETAPEPAAAPVPDTPAPKGAYTGKLARNKRTGRIMPWSAAMAKMSHMEEV